MYFDSPHLTFKGHIDHLVTDCTQRLNILKCISSHSWGADRQTLTRFYMCFIRSKIDYGCQVYNSAAQTHLKKLEVIQNSALRIILGALRSTRVDALRVESCMLPLSHRRDLLMGQYYYKLCYASDQHPVVINLLHSTREYSLYRFRSPRLQPFVLRARSLLSSHSLPIDYYRHQPKIDVIPPWREKFIDIYLDLLLPITKTTPLQLQRDVFYSTIDIRHGSFFSIYTDGSLIPQNDNNTVSVAFFIPHLSITNSFRLSYLFC